MFNTIIGRVFNGLFAIYMTLLSSYKGNNPQFSEFSVKIHDGIIVIENRLLSAFDNDFEDIFKSGKEIDVVFTLKISSNRRVIDEFSFIHSVVYDNLGKTFIITNEEQFYTYTETDYNRMLKILSYFRFEYPYGQNLRYLNIELTASLPKIYLDAIERDIDLMMLWNYKTPSVNERFEISYD